MNIFSLENSNFFFSLGISILVSAAVMYYCLGKFSVLENSIIEQGKIIQSFILRMNSTNMNANIANEQATKNAIDLSKKIEVSDDDDDSDDGDDDDSDDNDNNDDADDDDSDNDETNVNNIRNIVISGGKNIDSNDSDDSFSDVMSEDINTDNMNAVNVIADITDITDITDIADIIETIDNNSKHIDIEEITDLQFSTYESIEKNTTHPSNITSEICSLTSEHCDDQILVTHDNSGLDKDDVSVTKSNKIANDTPFNKMKVPELRKLVIEKNLVSSSDGSKLKKDELINLLKK